MKELGVHNPRLESVRALLTPKGRGEQGRYGFEGPTLVRDAAAARVPIEAVYATPAAIDHEGALFEEIERRQIPIFRIESRAMARISDHPTPPGILAVAAQRWESPSEALQGNGLVLVLADIADPANAGTLLRAAEAFGVRHVVAGSRGVDLYSPKVVRGAMGAVFRLGICRAAPEEIEGALAAHPGRVVTGLDAGGAPLSELTWPGESLLVVGSERHGLADWAAICTRLAAIPMRGAAESLNAAMAGTIALYEASAPSRA